MEETNKPENTEQAEDQEELEFEAVYGETDAEIIACCFNAYTMVDGIDTAMMSKKERDRVVEIRTMALELCYQSLKNIYEANGEQ